MDTASWVAPTIAVSLVIIAASFLVMGGVALVLGIGILRISREARAKLAALTADARTATARLRGELDGYADLATETRLKLRRGVDAVEGRLQDLDALVEVLQEEAEETALDVAAMVRTVRRSGRVLGAARKALKRRRGSDD
jgi:hypothetical protein